MVKKITYNSYGLYCFSLSFNIGLDVPVAKSAVHFFLIFLFYDNNILSYKYVAVVNQLCPIDAAQNSAIDLLIF